MEGLHLPGPAAVLSDGSGEPFPNCCARDEASQILKYEAVPTEISDLRIYSV
jgi:hypothetical protein